MQRRMTRWALLAAALTTSATAVALEADVIDSKVNEQHDALSTCYERAVDRNPNLGKGTIITRFVVAKSGKVSQAQVTRNDLKDSQLGECVRQVFLDLDFGDQEKPANITYPLDFE